MANTAAEPVLSVSHQMSANCTSALPTSEKACPVQMAKKRVFHPGELILLPSLFRLAPLDFTENGPFEPQRRQERKDLRKGFRC
jgi:hypothetical protein